MDKPKILIIEDDEFVAKQMKWALATDHDVLIAEDRFSALELFKKEHPSVITLDLGLPPSTGNTTEGFLALNEMLQVNPLAKIIIITGQGEQENALNGISQGAYDFFCKPVDVEALKTVVSRAINIYRLEKQNLEKLQDKESEFQGMLGKCPKMQSVFQSIRKVAETNAPVLISGESGTGKELAARAIHNLSSRSKGPFIAINCGAIPENLLESELFGHEKGAFTGAHMSREGRLETANEGTLFLDEIGELPLNLQVKLLRFLQEHTVERVGGRKQIRLDVRVICATNTDLLKAMADGEFREDLYYRIGVVVIALPPLRERHEDITLLAEHFLQKLGAEHKKKLSFDKKALEAMETCPWPGNIREMENRLKRAVIMTDGKLVTPRDLALDDGSYAKYESMGLNKAREAVEKDLIEKAIERNRGNLSKCADDLQISRSSLYDLINKLGISR